MDDEVLIIVVFSIVLVFLLILLIRLISNWVRPSKSKADKELWESKTNPLSNLIFHSSGVILIISLIVPVIGVILMFTGNDWGAGLVIFGFLWLGIIGMIFKIFDN